MTVAPEKPPTGQPACRSDKQKQKRARVRNWQIALTPEEFAGVQKRALAAGLSASSFGRAVLLGTAGLRGQSTPTMNAEVIAQATAALNKVGSNLSQIARKLNAGQEIDSTEAQRVVTEAEEFLALLREAPGWKPHP